MKIFALIALVLAVLAGVFHFAPVGGDVEPLLLIAAVLCLAIGALTGM